MANQKISDLTTLTSLDDADLVPVVDVSDTTMAATGTNKKITAANIKSGILPTTTKGDLSTYSTTATRLAVGSNGERLVADSTQATGLKYVADTTNYAVLAKADVLVGSAANTLTALSIGSDNQVLTADSTHPMGIKWATAANLTNTAISPTTANVTASVNTRYFADISGLTASRNFVVPAGVAGNVIELNITKTHASYALVIIGDTGISINGGTAATEWSRLFIANESIQLVATSTTNWQVMIDKRIPCYAMMNRITTSITTNTAATETVVDWNNIPFDNASLGDTTNDRFNLRRSNKYKATIQYRPYNAVTDQKSVSLLIYKNTTQYGYCINRAPVTGAAMLAAISNRVETFSAGDYIQFKFMTEENNIGYVRDDQGSGQTGTSFCLVEEIL